MSSTTTRNKIGQEDIKWWDGISDTFTRETSTGGLLTLNKLGQEVYVAEAYGSGTVSETALVSAVGQIGTTRNRTLLLREGTWSLTSNLTIPSNLTLKLLPGAILDVATGITLTVNGPIEAGPQQIFSWTGTGTFNISGSPTEQIFLEWWGAVTGVGNDCTDAINMCFTARGNHQTVILLNGYYRITAAVTNEGSVDGRLSIKGNGKESSCFYIDIGGSGTGFTFGKAGTWQDWQFCLDDVGFIGPASCCEYGVKIYMAMIKAHNTNFFMGASEYGLAVYGCEHCSMLGNYIRYFNIGTVGPAGGMLMSKDSGSGYDNTVWTLDIHAHGNATPTDVFTNPALKILSLGVGDLYGVIESYTVPLEVGATTNANISQLNIHNLYMENGGATGTYCTFTGATNLVLHAVLFNDSYLQTVFDGCNDISITSCSLVDTIFKANCRGINLGSNIQFYSTKIYDEGNSIISSGESRNTPVIGDDRSNILYNSSLSRWTTTAPDNFDATIGTHTKCGIGLGDTTKHNTPYCDKITTGAAYASLGTTLDATQLSRVLGRTVTWNVWAYVDEAETFTSVTPYIGVTLPAWNDANAYKIGEGYIDGTPNNWVVITAGTSGAVEPTWPAVPTFLSQVTDNTVIWGYRDDTNIVGGRYDVADMGKWRPVGITKYIPTNATAVTVGVLIYRDTTDCSAYISEPTLTVGQVANTAFIPGSGEAIQSFIQIGPNKISYGTAVPASGWCQQGDIVWRTDATTGQSPGWICTTSGVGGVGAVWKTFGVVS